jgi:hypothetical protein
MQPEGGEVIASGHLEVPTTPAVAKRCRNCNSDLSAGHLDLKSVAECFGQEEVPRSWVESAEAGCTFCRLVTAVEDDAKERYGFGWLQGVQIGLTTDGQYVLRLPYAITELPHTLEHYVNSTITVYLKGKASPIDRYKLIYQHHRSKSVQPLGGI